MPIYMVSTGTQIPELKRVIVCLGDRIAMEPTLNEALARVVGGPISAPPPMAVAPTKPGAKPAPAPTAAVPVGEVRRLVDQAVSQYEKAQDAQRRGDWAEYGRQVGAMKATLTELRAKAR